tara:strand:- start:213 stop:407 length:195 start_codon:yes stop_codon:yes gene_type:complete
VKVGDLVTTVEDAQDVEYEVTNLGVIVALWRSATGLEHHVEWIYTVGPVFKYYPEQWLRIVNES